MCVPPWINGLLVLCCTGRSLVGTNLDRMDSWGGWLVDSCFQLATTLLVDPAMPGYGKRMTGGFLDAWTLSEKSVEWQNYASGTLILAR